MVRGCRDVARGPPCGGLVDSAAWGPAVAGWKERYTSPSNAMLFCQGCVAEMGVDVLEAIRQIGSLGKIVYVHFRNIRGTPRNFQEVFVDEGDVDMYQAMQTYKEMGFERPFMMDHTSGIAGDREGRDGHAFVTGYIRAMIQAVYR